jgi:hypothetical protein
MVDDAGAPDRRGMDLDDIAELAPFVHDGRLVEIPRRRAKRLILLDRLAQAFEPGRHYGEAEVNRVLGEVHHDFVTLRRYLVDEGFFDREAGEYWRSGGSVSPDR